MNASARLLIAAIFPMALLMIVAIFYQYTYAIGYKVTLPLHGFDPTDLISGHFVSYSVDYGVKDLCAGNTQVRDTYICLDNHTANYSQDSSCKHFIKGICRRSRFEAGIERFYIPEKGAYKISAKTYSGHGSIVVSVLDNGEAFVEKLLIDGNVVK